MRKREAIGAHIASAKQKRAPNRYGPPAPHAARVSRQDCCTRATCASTPGRPSSFAFDGMPFAIGQRFTRFIGIAARSSAKLLCISAADIRAAVRARSSAGHMSQAGARSHRYSAIASVSVTTKPSSTSTGMRPVGETSASRALLSGRERNSVSAAKGRPESLHASQPRMVQVEDHLPPMISRMA